MGPARFERRPIIFPRLIALPIWKWWAGAAKRHLSARPAPFLAPNQPFWIGNFDREFALREGRAR